MALTSVLPKIKVADVDGKKAYIPLEHNVYATQRVGRVVPYMTRWVDANGKHKIDLETLNYMSPMIAPTVGDIRLKHWLYWIPLDRLSPVFANMFSKQKAVKSDGTEMDVTQVPYMELHYLSTLCLIGSFCTIYFKDKKAANSQSVLPWRDGKTYLFPTNAQTNNYAAYNHIEDNWNAYTHGDFVNTGTVNVGDEGKTVLAQFASQLLGGMTAWCINAKFLYPSNNIVSNSANQYQIRIPLANPTYESFYNWIDSSGAKVYDGKHLDLTHGIDCSPVSLENPDYCVNRSFAYTDSSNEAHDITVTFAFRFSDFGRALRDVMIAAGYQLNFASTKKVSMLPFFANYLAYFYAQPLMKYKNWQNTAAYKILRRYETENIVNLGQRMINLQNTSSIDVRLFVEFINDLASMWAVEPQDFVSCHTREPLTSPLVLNSLDSFLNSVAGSVATQTNPPAVPISQSNSQDEPNSILPNNMPYINNVNHDVVTASLLQRITQRMAVNSIIGRPIRKLLRSMGYGDWVDHAAPNLVDYGELRLNLKPVVSTADTASSSDGSRGADLGQLGGRGYGHKYHNAKPFANHEPGYFVLLTTVYVNSGYCQSIDANNFCVDVDDFYKREFDAQGFEVDEKNQIQGSLTWVEDGDEGTLDRPFGFVPRSTKFKHITNKLLGDFTDGPLQDVYSPYHLDKLLPVGKRSLNEVKDYELYGGYNFTAVTLGSRFKPEDVPIAGNIWRYLGRFPWMGQFDRIFKLYDYDVRKIQGVYGLSSDNFFELVSKIYAYFVSTPENYTFLNTIHYDSWQDKKPISESFGTLSQIFEGSANNAITKE